MKLIIANQRYSSWSLRPWLLLQHYGIDAEIEVWNMFAPERLRPLAAQHAVPPAVPVLITDAGQALWESLAIMEFLAEQYPALPLWPQQREQRALARCLCAEMHTGFTSLRSQYPMNCAVRQKLAPSAHSRDDLARLAALWEQLPGEQYCFDEFGITDAMFAPVALRVLGWELSVSERFDAWAKQLTQLPALQQWFDEGAKETYRHPPYHLGEELGPFTLPC